MAEILVTKRAGVYLNGEHIATMTDVTVKVNKEVNEHPVIGDDKRLFAEGIEDASFTFGGLHFSDSQIAFLSSHYGLIMDDGSQVDPYVLNNLGLQSRYAIWQTTESGSSIPVYNDSSPDENYRAAQSFIAAGDEMSAIRVKMIDVGSPTINSDMNVAVYADSGDAPTGAALITGKITAATLNGISGESWVNVTSIVNTTALSEGTKYWLVFYFVDNATENGDSSNYIGLMRSDTDTYKPLVYDKSKSADQATDADVTHAAASTDGGSTYTPHSSDRDACFKITFITNNYLQIAVRLVIADGTTVTWVILHKCVFNPEEKDFPTDDALHARYSGLAEYGEYKGSYP